MIEYAKAHYGKAVAFATAWLLEAKLSLSQYVNEISSAIIAIVGGK